jgi:hypothetical protein
MYRWRAVDDEGEVLDILMQQRRNKRVMKPSEPVRVGPGGALRF